MSNVKIYTAADIQRYHNGGMNPAERHSLEKAALEDPMLADALDGYANTTTPAADLQSLQSRLQQRIEKDTKTKVFFMNSQWLKIAALFLVIAGGGWLVVQSFVSQNDNIANVQRDSVSTEENTTSAATSPQDTAAVDEKNVTAATGTEQAPAQAKINPPALSVAATDAATSNKTRNQSGRGSAEMNESKTGEVASAPAAPLATIKDNTAVRTRNASTDTLNQTNVALQKAEATAVEMTTGNSTAKARKREQAGNLPEPDGGWAIFEKYVAANRKLPAGVKFPAGVVVLSFDVDNTGRAINITVSKPLCESCDAEAIRLLKEGPGWRSSGTKGSVTISF